MSFLQISYDTSTDIKIDGEKLLKSSLPVLPFANSDLYCTTLLEAKKLTSGPDVKAVYDLTVSLRDITHEFNPGDTIGILPCNDEHLVDKLVSRLGLEDVADKVYVLSLANNTKKNVSLFQHLPQTGTIRELLLKNIDLHSPPKKIFLKSLLNYTSDENEVRNIQHLCSKEGSSAYNDFISGKGRSLKGILDTFASCQPPIELLLEHLPSLKPRPYSISSSPLEDNLHITFFVLQHDDGTKGVCTGWLEKLILNNNLLDKLDDQQEKTDVKIQFYFRKSHTFHLPSDNTVPIVMIGTGTGIAPFRGFMRHRTFQKQRNDFQFGQSWLFYGCRYASRDFLYKSEITQCLKDGILNRLHVAFSREFRDKVYVQHKIEEYGAELSRLILEENAVIFICGSAKTVVADVKESLRTILLRFGHLDSISVTNLLNELEKRGRCITDVWS